MIFGHTVYPDPTHGPDREWLCLDTNLRNYAVVSFDEDKLEGIYMSAVDIREA